MHGRQLPQYWKETSKRMNTMTNQNPNDKVQDIGEDVLRQLREQDLVRAEKAEHLFKLMSLRKPSGFAPDQKLEARLRKLPGSPPEEVEGEVASLGVEVLNAVVTHDEKISPPAPEPRVNPKPLFDYLAHVNPFFQRWLEFRSQIPAADPESWDEFAVQGIANEDHEYARVMRELGQMLVDLIHRKKQITQHLATCFLNSHLLHEPERYLNTASWVYMAEEDAEK
jgi:hypothetical protein